MNFRQAMKCLTWNLEWASPSSKPGRLITEKIQMLRPDVICYTEVISDFISQKGSSIEAGSDYGYPHDGVIFRPVILNLKDLIGD